MRGDQFEDIYWDVTGNDWAIPRWVMVKYGQTIAERAWNEGYQDGNHDGSVSSWAPENPYEETK